jgi:23S rRNA pseudouridine2457 synthase
MPQIVLFNKPFNVLSQFTDSEADRPTLATYLDTFPGFYPAGRLDFDSEGLMLLTNCGELQDTIANPRKKMAKTYLVQVEGVPDETALSRLAQGIQLKDGMTSPAKVRRIETPDLWTRDPPIRHRANIPTSWIQLTITEGRNRQVRRMTAAAGHPTLRLIRVQIGPWQLGRLAPGEFRLEEIHLAGKNSRNKHR